MTEMTNSPNINAAIFSFNWLGVSETFIFRQTEYLWSQGNNSVIILTENLVKSDLIENSNTQHKAVRVYHRPQKKRDFYLGIIQRKLMLKKNLYGAFADQKRHWRQAIAENHSRIIHAHYGTGGLKILPVAKTLNIPLVTTFHGNDASAMLRKKAYLRSLKELFNYSYIIAVSHFIKKRLINLGAPEQRIFTHYIGTDLNRFQFTKRVPPNIKYKEQGVLNFIQISNFVEKKGHKYTIDAFSRLLRTFPNCVLHLGGDGPLKKELEAQVKRLGIEDNVLFLGKVSPTKVPRYFEEADVFLHHSVTGTDGSEEGIPTVIMEAMASGLPVVSTRHAGIPELIEHGHSGYLVTEKDIDEYHNTLLSLFDDQAVNIADNAREKIDRDFNMSKQNKKLTEIYRIIFDVDSTIR